MIFIGRVGYTRNHFEIRIQEECYEKYDVLSSITQFQLSETCNIKI